MLFLLVKLVQARLTVVDFNFDETFTLQTKGDISTNQSEILSLRGPPKTHFTVLIRPELDHYYCLDDIVRIYDDSEKVDLLDSVCGRFDQKPIVSCSNRVLVEVLSLAKRTDWSIDFISANTTSTTVHAYNCGNVPLFSSSIRCSKHQSRIVNGNTAAPYSWPWIV